MYYSVEQAAAWLGLHRETILRELRHEPRRYFRGATCQSRKKGYRLPLRDILEYAALFGQDVVEQVRQGAGFPEALAS